MNTELCNRIHDAAFVMSGSINKNSLMITTFSFTFGVLVGFQTCSWAM